MRAPLTPDVESKDGSSSADARLINCLKETKPTGIELVEGRPGLTQYAALGTAAAGQGLSQLDGALCAIYGASIYKPSAGAIGSALSLPNASATAMFDFVQSTTVAFSATGGVITYVGGNKIHTFNSSGNLVCTGTLPNGAASLIVGGGGGGGSGRSFAGGGGGGAGAIKSLSAITLTGTMPVVVGTGGAAGNGGGSGSDGASSSFNGTTSIGGGFGGKGGTADNGHLGGSGGGGGGGFSIGGVATDPAYGNDGASGVNPNAGGGGGGGGGAGVMYVSPATAPNGGVGVSSSISGSAVFYAGGGGGADAGGVNGAGGSGVGGAGTGASGTANSGSGGGGVVGLVLAGAGADGVVIISYPYP